MRRRRSRGFQSWDPPFPVTRLGGAPNAVRGGRCSSRWVSTAYLLRLACMTLGVDRNGRGPRRGRNITMAIRGLLPAISLVGEAFHIGVVDGHSGRFPQGRKRVLDLHVRQGDRRRLRL